MRWKEGSLYQTWVYLYASKYRSFVAHQRVLHRKSECSFSDDSHTLLSSASQMEPPTSCPTLEFILILLYAIWVIYTFGPIAEPKTSDFRLMTKGKAVVSVLSINVWRKLCKMEAAIRRWPCSFRLAKPCVIARSLRYFRPCLCVWKFNLVYITFLGVLLIELEVI